MFSSGPISTYTQLVPIPSTSTSTYPNQVSGVIHTVNVVSVGTYSFNGPPGLIKDGYTSVDSKVIAVIDGNTGKGPLNGPVDQPFDRGLRIEPAPGQTLVVSYSINTPNQQQGT